MKDMIKIKLYEERLIWAENKDASTDAWTLKGNPDYIKPAEFELIQDKLKRKNKVMLVCDKGWGKTELANSLYQHCCDSEDLVFFGDSETECFHSGSFCAYINKKVGDLLKKRRTELYSRLNSPSSTDDGQISYQEEIGEITAILDEQKTNFSVKGIYWLPKRYLPQEVKNDIVAGKFPDPVADPLFLIFDFPDRIAIDKRLFWRKLEKIDNIREQFNYCGVLVLAVPNVYDNYAMDKWDTVIAKNYSIEQLVAIYKKRWGSSEPFSEDALLQVASVSKGLPRPFKANIALCLNKFKHLELISRDMVIQAGVAEDIATGLMKQAFKNKDCLELASLMLQYFRLTGSCKTDSLRDYLIKHNKSVSATRMLISRFYRKLSEAGLIEEPERSGKGSKILEVRPSKRLREYL